MNQSDGTPPSRTTRYRGLRDASAATALDDHHLLVAGDEDDILRIYLNEGDGFPIAAKDLHKFLKVPKGREADIEGAARVGDRVYWITSHGANRKGKKRPARRRFFATRISAGKKGFRIEPVGKPYRDLLTDLDEAPALRGLGLKELAKQPPKKGGLNIEGLAATPEGKRVWVGFRSPVPEGKALLVLLENPAGMIERERARIGPAAFLDLGGLGLRELEYLPSRSAYLLVAGPPGKGGPFRLFLWSGFVGDPPANLETVSLEGWNPEAVAVYDGGERIQLLSDDGARVKGEKPCKERKAKKQSFRGLWIPL